MSSVVQHVPRRADLRKALDSGFSEDELKSLAYDLEVDYESLPYQGKSGLARELLRVLERLGRIPELIDILRRIRPNALRQVDEGYGSGHAIGRYLPYWGEVEAGDTAFQGDGLRFHGEGWLVNDLGQSVFVPDAPSGENVGVLRVKGSSMLDEGVHDGDWVVVRLLDDARLHGQENRMIVTWYLPENSVRSLDREDLHDIINSANLPFWGPTLKVFKGRYVESGDKKIYRLGRIKDDGKHNSNEIRAVVIRPIGIVLKIFGYREIWCDGVTFPVAPEDEDM